MNSIFSKRQDSVNKNPNKNPNKTKSVDNTGYVDDDVGNDIEVDIEVDTKLEGENRDKNLNEQTHTLSFDDIIKSIPADATKNPNPHIQKDYTEWRWRFFDLNGRKLIEISKKLPSGERICIDNTGKWKPFELDNNWDQYLIDTKYSYAK